MAPLLKKALIFLRFVNYNTEVGFGVPITALMKIPVFWHIKPCILVCVDNDVSEERVACMTG
jgi:hypothetical protein